MTALQDIATFPKKLSRKLETEYGIETAESFWDHAHRDGIAEALGVDDSKLDKLIQLVEGYISPEYLNRLKAPAIHRPRGLLIDPD